MLVSFSAYKIWKERNDVKFQDFIRVFPTEISSIIQALRKSRGSAKTVPEKHQWFPDKKTSTEEYFSRSVATLSHCLEEICRCSNSRCFYRIRGVKYDIVCRLYEHIHEHKVSVPPSILYMKIKEVERKASGKGHVILWYRHRFEGTTGKNKQPDMCRIQRRRFHAIHLNCSKCRSY
ncbi:hypothetical protein OS493_000133 [Desmophyllum pertusum]|uniref:Uncharacterized protein n=1 Tax=Desmophyllum pertusum TaxID=174260 RepID=A0A9X0AA38_9CNID|nr:hypothetical protein OS493_000133 [Desmophyllum pertusum]